MAMVKFFDHWPWGKFQGVMVMVSALPPLLTFGKRSSSLSLAILVQGQKLKSHVKSGDSDCTIISSKVV